MFLKHVWGGVVPIMKMLLFFYPSKRIFIFTLYVGSWKYCTSIVQELRLRMLAIFKWVKVLWSVSQGMHSYSGPYQHPKKPPNLDSSPGWVSGLSQTL